LLSIGFVADGDAAKFKYYREAELKHGRVAQLAVFGYIVQEFFRFPGALDGSIPFNSIPNGVAAVGVVPSLGWLQIVASIGKSINIPIKTLLTTYWTKQAIGS
jgi:hypothetical protein